MKRLSLGIFILLCLSVASVCADPASGMALSDLQVLAVVKLNKSESITLRQLKTRVEIYQKQTGKVFSLDDKKKILSIMIEEKLIAQAAQKAGIVVLDSQVDQYFLQSMSQQIGRNVTEQELGGIVQKMTKLSLDDYMRQQTGMSTAEYKDYLKTQLIDQQYIVSQRQTELQGIAPSDEEIRSFYELNKASFVWSDMIKIFLVVIPKDSDGTAGAAKVKATELLNGFKDKKQTADQLSVKSRMDKSGFQAGDLLVTKTERNATQLGISYQNLLKLFTQNAGYVSDLQENPANFQFYAITQKYDAKMLSLSDVVQPGTTVTVYDYIKQNLAQQKKMEYLQNAAEEISKSLNVPDNVENKKTGDALDKLLNWEGTK